MPDLQNHTELTWEEKLVERLKELDDARREASDTSINDQVQGNMQQIRDKNQQIVVLTQQKEEIESKMLQLVNDEELRQLQKQHSELIRKYEDIIKNKIDIFGDMIANLRTITDTNT
jgi:hypothetical protein